MFKNLDTSVLGASGSQSEIIELALTHGFKAIDLDIVDFADRAKQYGMPYARRLLDSSRLKITSFALPFKLDDTDDVFQKGLEQLPTLAAAAADMGCTRCLTSLAPAGDTLPYHENFEWHRARLGEVCRALAASDVRLGVGFRAAAEVREGKAFQFVHEIDALGLLLKMVGASNLGMVLDVWDLVVAGGSVESIHGLDVQQIVAVQLADAPLETPLDELTEVSRLLPGETGRIDIAAFLAALAEKGYDGPVTAKPHKNALPAGRRDVIAKRVAESLDRVWKAAGLTAEGRLGAPVEPSAEPDVTSS